MLTNPYISSAPGIVRSRLEKALRFRKPPDRIERAIQRKCLLKSSGPFENPVRRFVRLREKSRIFSILPPPKTIPTVLPTEVDYLKPLANVPKVSPKALEKRLEFLLSEDAIKQQLYAKLRPHQTPHHAEYSMWKHQMVEIRHIYRAQYLQKLSAVTNEERLKQIKQMRELYESKQKQELRQQTKLYEDRRRRALLADHNKLEAKVFESAQVVRKGRRMARTLRTIQRFQEMADFITPENVNEKILRDKELLDRNVSVPKLLQQLKLSSDDDRVSPHLEARSFDLYRQILEESFAYLPEDECTFGQTEQSFNKNVLTDKERAKIAYKGFSEAEKLKLLDQKISMVREKLAESEYSFSKGGAFAGSTPWAHLLDQLEATKAAHLEKFELKQDRKTEKKNK